MAVQGHFIVFCRYREAVKQFMFLPSLYIVTETCNIVQCLCGGGGLNKNMCYFMVPGMAEFENHAVSTVDGSCFVHIISLNGSLQFSLVSEVYRRD